MASSSSELVYPVFKFNLLRYFQSLPFTCRDYTLIKRLVNVTSMKEVRELLKAFNDPFVNRVADMLFDWSALHTKYPMDAPFTPVFKIPWR